MCVHRVINGASGLLGDLSVELYNPSDCKDEDYIFIANGLGFGQYQLFENVSVAEWVAIILVVNQGLYDTV